MALQWNEQLPVAVMAMPQATYYFVNQLNAMNH
jgi:hypothetical protein